MYNIMYIPIADIAKGSKRPELVYTITYTCTQ